MGIVQKAIDADEVGRDRILADLSDEVKAGLDATAVKAAADAVQTFLGASPADAPAAKAALSAALGAASWVDDPNVIAKAALEAALQHDLRFVAPLGQVDVDAGGIAGKPWQTRLAKKIPTVEIAGIALPVEGKAQPLALPMADDGAGKKNLQQLATRWLARRPVSVVGADGPDAVRALARATGAALVDVVIKPDTSVHDLFGAGGAITKAMDAGAVVHMHLEGAAWPAGLGQAVMSAAAKARLIATGPALAGFPALTLAPLDEASVAAHLHALGVADEAAVAGVAAAFLDVRALARGGGAGDLDETAFPLALLDRIAARLTKGGGEMQEGDLYRALDDVLARRVSGDARGAVTEVIQAHARPSVDADEAFGASGKNATIAGARFAVVGTPAEASALPALTGAEKDELRAAATALELGEPVVADPGIAERVGTLYGALTGRDVHVHLLHANSKPEDVLGEAGKDVVAVLHDFTAAPPETQAALWAAAAEGRVRIVAADAAGVMTSDGVVLREGPMSADDQSERLQLRARELGVPEAVADGMSDLKNELDAMVNRGELHPLVDMSAFRDLESALELMAQLGGAMSTIDAFVAAASASYPMSTPEEQQMLEDTARRIAEP